MQLMRKTFASRQTAGNGRSLLLALRLLP